MTLEALLEDSDRWRLQLADTIVRRNGPVGERALNRYLQKSLLDAAFLEICSRRNTPQGAELLRHLDSADPTAGGLPRADLPEFAASRQLPHPTEELLGSLHQRALARPIGRVGSRTIIASGRSARQGQGVYYTPRFVVDYIVQQVLAPLCGVTRITGTDPIQPHDPASGLNRSGPSLGEYSQPPSSGEVSYPSDPTWLTTADGPTILDPACGAGVFLNRAYAYLAARYRGRTPDPLPAAPTNDSAELPAADRVRIVRRHLFGVDRDPHAVRSARLSLALRMLGCGDEPDVSPAWIAETVRHNIRCGDSLLDPEFKTAGDAAGAGSETRAAPFDWQAAFPGIFQRPGGGFDAVVGNPPYVNIRRITQQLGPQVKQYFRDNFRSARGSFDLYVLFIERAFDLLRPAGRFGMIVPNKLATLGYAEACRRLLLTGTTIEEIVDAADLRIFQGTGVYPCILVWHKAAPVDRQHLVRVITPGQAQKDLAHPLPVRRVKQSALSAERGFVLAGQLDVESRAATVPLGELAELHSGTTGFSAAKLAHAIVECHDTPLGIFFDFIVSGNIDRYRVTQGNVRFMKRVFRRPMLPVDAACLSRGKRVLFHGPKIVIAGMTRRLEAAYHPGGTALGVQVYAVNNPQVDPNYLLALLNSQLISQLFRQRFAAKRLGGGYLAINKAQLSQLPIRTIDPANRADRAVHDRLVTLAQRLTELHQPTAAAGSPSEPPRQAEIEQLDAEIDVLVELLYGVEQQELAA